MAQKSKHFLKIYLDTFFVAVEQVENPELKGKLVVVGGKPDRRSVVMATSYGMSFHWNRCLENIW